MINTFIKTTRNKIRNNARRWYKTGGNLYIDTYTTLASPFINEDLESTVEASTINLEPPPIVMPKPQKPQSTVPVAPPPPPPSTLKSNVVFLKDLKERKKEDLFTKYINF